MKVNNRRRARMSRKTGAIIALSVALVLTVLVGLVSLNGMNQDSRGLRRISHWLPNAQNWPQPISLGLDLQGGVYVEYECTLPEDMKEQGYNFQMLLDSTIGVIQNRLTEKGFTEATVSQLGQSGIRVEIPSVKDPMSVLSLIGSPAKLEFLDPEGNVFMEGRHLQTAVASKDENSQPCIDFTLTDEGTKLFSDMTASSIGKTLTIQLDGQELMSPTVNTVIPNGRGIITGLGSAERAETIALQIQSGALPLDMSEQKVDTISATLGKDALSTSITAAIIGIALVMLIMLLRYRLCGVVADWALCVYIILLFFFIAIIPGVQLTLPGIAGIILGIGMAVDANVVIFERVKEEVKVGRPMQHAVRIGFKNAMSAVLDANVTTIIAAVVLLVFGTGSIRGFATTLLLGVLVSMLSAIVVTRFLLTRFVRIWQKPALYTSQKAAAQAAQAAKEAE